MYVNLNIKLEERKEFCEQPLIRYVHLDLSNYSLWMFVFAWYD